MAEFLPLSDAIAKHVADGACLALEGFTHLIPFAAGHELIRQGRRELHLAIGVIAPVHFARFVDQVEHGLAEEVEHVLGGPVVARFGRAITLRQTNKLLAA